jgi:hypothetical protein
MSILGALGDLGDFIGGFAVVVTLVYLTLQVRQNTAALRTASRQEIVSGFRAYNKLALDPAVELAARVGMRSYPDMRDDQKGRFGSLINDHALFFQGAFALHEAGTLEEETYQVYLQFFSAWVITPGGAAWWREISPLYTPRMVAAVDARIAQGALPDLTALEVFQVPPAV